MVSSLAISKVSVESPEQIEAFLNTSPPLIACDIETTGLKFQTDQIRTIAFSDGSIVKVLDCFKYPKGLKYLIPSIERKNLIIHNAIFDLTFLYHNGLFNLPPTYCTLQANKIFYNGLNNIRNNLKSCLVQHLDIDIQKDINHTDWLKNNGELTEKQLKYIADDVIHLHALRKVLLDKLNEAHLLDTYKLECQALRTFVWMSHTGIPVNKEKWKDIDLFNKQELQKRIDNLNNIVLEIEPTKTLFDDDCLYNYNSHKQLKHLFSLIDYDLTSTSDATLANIEHPLAEALRDYREIQKLVTTYGEKWLANIYPNNRVYPNWNILGTHTGRTSSSEPNIQQIPRNPIYRKVFEASPGKVFIKSDVSQFQLRIAACRSRDSVMMDAYHRNMDLHSRTAEKVLGKKLDTVTKEDRQIAKSLNFGLLFGLGTYGLISYAKQHFNLTLDFDTAFKHRDNFFKTYTGLYRWHQQAQRDTSHETRTRIGRRRLFPEICKATEKLNTPVQGDEADAMKRSLARLWHLRHNWKNKCQPLLLAHDEILLECDEDYAEEAKQQLIDVMTESIQQTIDPIPAIVDASINKTWNKE